MLTVRSFSLAALATVSLMAPVQAQDVSGCFVRGGNAEAATQRPSPLGATVANLGGEEAKLCYGRPKANGRKVMGELVPFGSVWRMGANEATALHIPFAGDIGGVKVEPGVYSIYAVPGETEWEFFVNRQYERWGIPVNDAVKADDVGSFKRKAEATSEMVEQLTITWMPHGENMGHMVLQWENTKVEFPIHKGGM